MKALQRGSEIGDTVYRDADLLLYSGLMAQRRGKSEGRSSPVDRLHVVLPAFEREGIVIEGGEDE